MRQLVSLADLVLFGLSVDQARRPALAGAGGARFPDKRQAPNAQEWEFTSGGSD